MAGMMHSCSRCRHPIGGSIAGLTGGMGPARYRCVHCDNIMDSGKREWPELGFLRRLQFFIVSILYAVMLGLIYSIVVHEAYRITTRDMSGAKAAFSGLWFAIIWLAVGVIVLIVQGVRVARSIRRVRQGKTDPSPAGFFSPASNGFVLAALPAMALLIPVAILR